MEEKAEYIVECQADVETEIQRLLGKLEPELWQLLSGKDKFRVEIHGKPGTRCTYSITRIVE